uniref:At1g61320/AtMIF1 LRR domain-containing protein n=1 Tax=Leersia perrieri TaxID=77586 RepID=A0A0D9W5G8_9ORYZ
MLVSHQCFYIKPHSDIFGFRKLRRLHLRRVKIIGNLSGLLLNCLSLQILEITMCSGVNILNVPQQLDKLTHLLVCNTSGQMIEFHVPALSHFGYIGTDIPIVLHGCSKLKWTYLSFLKTYREEDNNKVLGHVFHGIPSVSAVKVLTVHADINAKLPVWSSQMQMLTTGPASMFMNLRYLTYEITVSTTDPDSHSGILQLAPHLSFAPQLEALELHKQMSYQVSRGHFWHGEGVSHHLPRHDHLRIVYMTGFRCYRAQAGLMCSILEMGAALEHVAVEPMTRISYNIELINSDIPVDKICEWAHRASKRFGKAITVVKPP